MVFLNHRLFQTKFCLLSFLFLAFCASLPTSAQVVRKCANPNSTSRPAPVKKTNGTGVKKKPSAGRSSSSSPSTYSAATGTANGHGYVDLGLSVKWATCNVGASSPTGYGDYYAWGETTAKSDYSESNSTTYGKNYSDIAGEQGRLVAAADSVRNKRAHRLLHHEVDDYRWRSGFFGDE